MIRLGKNKTLDNYFIDENGVITDQLGNVQKLKIHQGYLEFKNIGVHKIQIWSNLCWKDGHKFVIHHIDENKLNNSLSNLIFVTKSEHNSIHKKGNKNPNFGKRGNKNSNFGRHHSEEIKQKISKSMKGRIWVNNGVISKLVIPSLIPNGFKKGRI